MRAARPDDYIDHRDQAESAEQIHGAAERMHEAMEASRVGEQQKPQKNGNFNGVADEPDRLPQVRHYPDIQPAKGGPQDDRKRNSQANVPYRFGRIVATELFFQLLRK